MQTSIATVCLSGSLSESVRSPSEAHPDHAEQFEDESVSFGGEREEVLERIAAMLVLTFVAATITWLPRAQRF